jgi:hypothetical protein
VNRDADVVVRLERTAAVVTAVLVVAAWVGTGGRTDIVAGIVGGWLLVAASAWFTRTSLEGLLALGRRAAAGEDGSRPYLRMMMRFIGRYALLGFGAYVMIARLRLSPIGMLVGASSIVLSASVETARTLFGSRAR